MYFSAAADKKWSKRSISIGSGTLKILKKDRPYDKDYMHTINLENFDIYTFVDTFSPNSKLRCPTSFSFVLKSQHKQSLFGKDSVFAYYFAVESQDVFAQWHGVIRDAKSRLIAEKKGIAPWVAPAVSEDAQRGPQDERMNPFADVYEGSPVTSPAG